MHSWLGVATATEHFSQGCPPTSWPDASVAEPATLPFPEAQTEYSCVGPVSLYAARTEDLGPGDFVKVHRAACGHTALLTTEFLTQRGLEPYVKTLCLKYRVRCRGCGIQGRTVVSIKWAKTAA
jgi:hypothetical protein